MPVRVQAALTLIRLVKTNEKIYDVLKPALGQVFELFLAVLDEIDYEELMFGLQQLVVMYQDQVAPFALSLCTRLSQYFLRLLQQR